MLRFYQQVSFFLMGLLEAFVTLNCNFLHVVGIVTIGEEKKICTVSENFLRMCESTEVSIFTAFNFVRILVSFFYLKNA